MDGLINYLDHLKEIELMSHPELGWEWFNGRELHAKPSEHENEIAKLSCITCYSEGALFVLIKSNQKEIIHNDRSYQNGDGFHFVLAKPNEDKTKTREFYVIAISPLDNGWRKKFVWYRNVDLAISKLKNTEVKYLLHNEEHHFLVRIPWEEIEPFNGYLSSHCGFNISYVQSTSNGKVVYMLKEDAYIQSEQSPREYLVYDFEKPTTANRIEFNWQLSSKHCQFGDNLSLKMFFNSPIDDLLELKISTSNDILVKTNISIKKGSSLRDFIIDTSSLSLGSHHLKTSIKSKHFNRNVTTDIDIYDKEMFNNLKVSINDYRISSIDDLLQVESLASLKFYEKSLNNSLNSIKAYERFDKVYEYYHKISSDFQKVKDGGNIFDKGKVTQYGHISDIDHSLEPYTLYIPESINQADEPSLLVYLHGSGNDDTSIKFNPLIHQFAEEHKFIILAPFGRGTSNYYCTHEAMEDVVELTKKISKMFSIKHDKVLLSGFSMGGYGVYRIFDYAPNIYKGLIVFSGHHSLGLQYGGPDYSAKKNIFLNIPIIIFHGTGDLNCNYFEHKSFFDALSHENLHCQVYVEKEMGHCGLIEEWYQPLSNWVRKYFGDN